MGVDVNWLAVLLAALSTMAIGSLWYMPKTFGEQWKQWARLDPKNMADPKKAIAIALVAALVTAYVLAHFSYIAFVFFGGSFLVNALQTAFWAWLGFTAVRVLTHDSFENRPWKLTALTVGHELVTFLVMAFIIGLLKP